MFDCFVKKSFPAKFARFNAEVARFNAKVALFNDKFALFNDKFARIHIIECLYVGAVFS